MAEREKLLPRGCHRGRRPRRSRFQPAV